jgi:LCP family protein required for cell wall assembly
VPDPHDPDAAPGYGRSERPRTGHTWAGIRIPRELIDGDAPARPQRPPGSVRRRAPHGLQLTAWVAGLLAVLVLGISGTGWGLVTYGDSRIQRIDAFAGLTNRPSQGDEEAVNYLLVGSDTREGIGNEYGTTAGARADVTIVMHVSRKRDKVVLLSFPRDSLVTIPAHRNGEGEKVGAKDEKINAALQHGGPPLLIHTVEQVSGLHIDHYLQIDFAGFKDMVDALGGVDICVPERLEDESAGLDLQPGQQRLDPEQALAFVRARKSDPRGDLGRMDRQQQLLGAMLRQATSAGVLTDPAKLARFVTAGLDSVTTDRGLSSGDLIDLGTRLRDLDAGHVQFVTVPVKDPNFLRDNISYMVLDEPAAEIVYEALRNDEPLGDDESAPDDTYAAGGVPPEEITLRVFNGTSTKGLGARVADALERAGFAIEGAASDADEEDVGQTLIRYDPTHEESLATIRAALPEADLVPVAGLGPVFEVIAGADGADVHGATVDEEPSDASADSTAAIETSTAADTACS